jgi:hypothetical protein
VRRVPCIARESRAAPGGALSRDGACQAVSQGPVRAPPSARSTREASVPLIMTSLPFRSPMPPLQAKDGS